MGLEDDPYWATRILADLAVQAVVSLYRRAETGRTWVFWYTATVI